MKNVAQNNIWHTGVVQIHADSPQINLIKSMNDSREEEYRKGIKFRIDPTSA